MVRRKFDIDKRIAQNRATADELDTRLSRVRLHPAKADIEVKRMGDFRLTFESPESSSILGASFNPDTGVVRVEFKLSDREVKAKKPPKVYEGLISPELWLDWLSAESKGSFFNTNVRPIWGGKQVAA